MAPPRARGVSQDPLTARRPGVADEPAGHPPTRMVTKASTRAARDGSAESAPGGTGLTGSGTGRSYAADPWASWS